MTFSHKRKPAWARELIQDGEKYGVPEGTTRMNHERAYSDTFLLYY
jgi:hypothetical protein